jgi:hypothetical protein
LEANTKKHNIIFELELHALEVGKKKKKAKEGKKKLASNFWRRKLKAKNIFLPWLLMELPCTMLECSRRG